MVLTWWLLRRDAVPDERRFEIDTLRRFLPVFCLYLVVAALWPPTRSIVPWHGALGFINRLNGAGVVDVLVLLEQVGGFTLFGYALAEWRGRRELSLAADLPRVVACAHVLSSSLELAQGVLSGPGALSAPGAAVHGRVGVRRGRLSPGASPCPGAPRGRRRGRQRSRVVSRRR